MADVSPAFQALRRKTAPLLLADRSRAAPHAVAYRAKHLGIYRERTWRDYAGLVGQAEIADEEIERSRADGFQCLPDIPGGFYLVAEGLKQHLHHQRGVAVVLHK